MSSHEDETEVNDVKVDGLIDVEEVDQSVPIVLTVSRVHTNERLDRNTVDEPTSSCFEQELIRDQYCKTL